MPRIDAHQHFWRYSTAEYGWIEPGPLARDFVPAELHPLLIAAHLDGCIAVQARQCEAETVALCALADTYPWIRGVVGWVDLRADDVVDRLDALTHPRIVGYRHVVQDERNPNFLDDPAFQRGIAALFSQDLAYDLLIRADQITQACRLVDRHSAGRIILDHAGKPPLQHGDCRTWATQFHELAQRPNVACKVSGLVTEADHQHWRDDDIIRVLDQALESFGPQRLLFGSDWPVCTLATTYARWRELVTTWAKPLSPSEQAALFGDNACTWYRLENF